MPYITCTHANAVNRIRKGSRITVYYDNGKIADRFEVPSWNGLEYCQRHTTGKYAKRLATALCSTGGL